MEHTASSGQDINSLPVDNGWLAALRGYLAGTAGLPGDLEGLVRKGINLARSTSNGERIDETPALPTTDFYKEWLPGKQTGADMIENLTSMAGGVGSTLPVKGAAKLSSRIAALPSAPLSGGRAAQLGIIKAPGGNWLTGSVEGALKGLRNPYVDKYAAELERWGSPEKARQWVADPGDNARAINKFIEGPLTRYVKGQMATEKDPIRALAERGVLHYDPHGFDTPRLSTQLKRQSQKAFPPEQAVLADSDVARRWENASDSAVASTPMAEYQDFGSSNLTREQPWIAKLDPETPMYRYDTGTSNQDLGFNHLIDELSNALNPESGLPRNLLLTPEQMKNMGMEKAVRHVDEINQWRAAREIEANMQKANNAATVLHKEYPDKGFKWVELRAPEGMPEGWQVVPESNGQRFIGPNGNMYSKEQMQKVSGLQDALKYEGDTMGHCVGGYCDDVASGRAKIYSLRDAKGEPHVTIEVVPKSETEFIREHWKDYADMKQEGQAFADRWVAQERAKQPPNIKQIKGKANSKPKDEYLPFVQDFVKSGKWGAVEDLGNSGLKRLSDMGDEPMIKAAREKLGDYATPEEWDALMREAPIKRAHGGRVSMIHPAAAIQPLVRVPGFDA